MCYNRNSDSTPYQHPYRSLLRQRLDKKLIKQLQLLQWSLIQQLGVKAPLGLVRGKSQGRTRAEEHEVQEGICPPRKNSALVA